MVNVVHHKKEENENLAYVSNMFSQPAAGVVGHEDQKVFEAISSQNDQILGKMKKKSGVAPQPKLDKLKQL